MSSVEPSLTGPRGAGSRPAGEAKRAFLDTPPHFGVDYGNAHDEAVAETFPASDPLAVGGRPGRSRNRSDAVHHNTAPRIVLAEKSRSRGDATKARPSSSTTAPS